MSLFAGHAEETPSFVIEVEAERLTDSGRPGSPLLQNVPGLSLREQGMGGAQSDLSVRGCAFNSTGLLLDGLTLRNAQTEHWHADMPVPDTWFGPPRVLTGVDRFRTASGHPSGSVSLTFTPLEENIRSATLGGGEKELFFGNALFTEVGRLSGGARTGASAFTSFESNRRTDGYAGNDLLYMTGGGRAGIYGQKVEADLIAVGSRRKFGARGFYGTSEKYPAEEEVGEALVAGSLRKVEDPEAPSHLTAAWQRVHDLYWLDKRDHGFYENEHTSDLFALHGADRCVFTDCFSLDARIDGDVETIDSHSLGDHTREHASLAILPNLTLGTLTFTAGGSLELFSAYSTQFCPAAGVSAAVAEGQTLGINCTESLRQPSYTELNYESPDSLGNRGLSLQKTRAVEAVWKGEKGIGAWKAAGFYERGEDIVDWIRVSPHASWTAVNLAPVNTWGAAADGSARIFSGTETGVDLLLLRKDCDTKNYAGRYALDYPEISGGVRLRQNMNKIFGYLTGGRVRRERGLSLQIRESVAQYASNPVREHGNTRLSSDAELQWAFLENLSLNLGGVNLLNDDFQIYPGQEVYGRRFYVSLTYTW